MTRRGSGSILDRPGGPTGALPIFTPENARSTERARLRGGTRRGRGSGSRIGRSGGPKGSASIDLSGVIVGRLPAAPDDRPGRHRPAGFDSFFACPHTREQRRWSAGRPRRHGLPCTTAVEVPAHSPLIAPHGREGPWRRVYGDVAANGSTHTPAASVACLPHDPACSVRFQRPGVPRSWKASRCPRLADRRGGGQCTGPYW